MILKDQLAAASARIVMEFISSTQSIHEAHKAVRAWRAFQFILEGGANPDLDELKRQLEMKPR